MLDLVEVEPGRERAVAAALGPCASAVLAPDAASALALVERAASSGLGALRVLIGRDPGRLVRELPVVRRDDLLDSPVAAVTVEGFGYDPARGELWFAGEAAETVQLELRSRRAALAAEAAELERAAERAIANAARAERAETAAEEAFAAIPAELRRLPSAAAAARLSAAGDRLDATLLAAVANLARFEAALDAPAVYGPPLRVLAEAETSAGRQALAAVSGATAAEAELARLGGLPLDDEPGDVEAARRRRRRGTG